MVKSCTLTQQTNTLMKIAIIPVLLCLLLLTTATADAAAVQGVPDAGNTGMLLAGALGMLACFRRRCR